MSLIIIAMDFIRIDIILEKSQIQQKLAIQLRSQQSITYFSLQTQLVQAVKVYYNCLILVTKSQKFYVFYLFMIRMQQQAIFKVHNNLYDKTKKWLPCKFPNHKSSHFKHIKSQTIIVYTSNLLQTLHSLSESQHKFHRMERVLKQKDLQQLYLWVDLIPLSRSKKNMARDFSDAVLIAEIIAHFTPKIIQLHNYIATGNIDRKLSNWKTLNDKVLKKLKIQLTKQDMAALANCEPNHAQKLIFLIKNYIEEQPELSEASRITKSKFKQLILPIPSQQKQNKFYSFKEIKKQKDVKQILTSKDQQIQTLKQSIELYALKFSKLEQIVKSKDRQIQQLVRKIKNKGIM